MPIGMVALICNRPLTEQNKFITKKWTRLAVCQQAGSLSYLVSSCIDCLYCHRLFLWSDGMTNLQVPRPNLLSSLLSLLQQVQLPVDFAQVHHKLSLFWCSCVPGLLTPNLITATWLLPGCSLTACVGLIECRGMWNCGHFWQKFCW